MRREEEEETGWLNVGKDAVSEATKDPAAAQLRQWGHCVLEPVGQKFSSRSSSTRCYDGPDGWVCYLVDQQRPWKGRCTLKLRRCTKLLEKARRRRVACVESHANHESGLSHGSHVSLTPITSAKREWMCSTVCCWSDEGITHLQ